MSVTNYAVVLGAVRVHIAAGQWVEAQRQLLIARTHAAETPDGNFDGAAYKLRTAELDKLQEGIQRELERDRAGANAERMISTRTNFPTRYRVPRTGYGY